MKKLLLVILCFLMLCTAQVFAQSRTVTGTVTAKDDGLPVPGVTVRVKGTTIGTQTNSAGKYSLSVPLGAVLQFGGVGFTGVNAPVKGNVLNVSLASSSNELGEVVVTTSLGIKHAAKTLGYSTASISAKELTQTNVTNVANGLTGKIAGLAIYTLDNGIDPNISVVLRGNRSLEGNNNALIVVDGVPIPGSTLSSINPNDIADVQILKGAGSAALYGSEASNGAILITTKRGTGNGKPTITYGNSVQFQKVAFYPKLQTRFGPYGGEPSYINPTSAANIINQVFSPGTDPLTGEPVYIPYENQQYGPAYDGSLVPIGAPLDAATGKELYVPYKAYPTSPIKAFFNTGLTEQNDVSFSDGDSQNSITLSAQNVYTKGITPNDKAIRNAFRIGGHKTYGIFSADYSVGYTKTNISTYIANNSPYAPGSYVGNAGANDLYSSILQLPAFLNIKAYQDPSSQIGNPNNYYDAYAINPYWIVDNARVNKVRDVLLANVTLKISPTKWFDASYRISDSYGVDQERATKQEVDFSAYAASDPLQAGNVPSGFVKTLKAPGYVADLTAYGDGTIAPDGYSRVQGDALLSFHHKFFKDFDASLLVGNTIWQQQEKFLFASSGSLLLKDFYNINTVAGTPTAAEGSFMIRQIAYYGDFNLSYKGWLTLDATLRNEQDSRLAKKQRSFSYPSVKFAFVPTEAIEALKNNSVLSYAKIYGSISRVGNIDISPYQIYDTYNVAGGFPFGSLGGLSAGTTNYSPTLKPELTTEVEIGTDLSLFKSRLEIDADFYNQHVKNQTVYIGTSITTGYNRSLLNIGETQSKGYEVQITGRILTQEQNKVGFTLGTNFTINQSKVISLLPGVNSLYLGADQYAVVGQPFPLLQGTDFNRDAQGHVIVSATTGYPSRSQTLKSFGRTTPKYIVGITPTLSYKFVSLSGVAEYRGGDVTYNAIGSTLTFTGAGFTSAEAGRQAFVYPNSVISDGNGGYVKNTNVNVQNGNYGFWQGSAYSSTNSPFVSSAAFWKIREINLSFKLDQFIKKTGFIKAATFSLTGRNLFIFVPKSNPWTDPEFSDVSPNSNIRGFNDANELPGTRIFGADLKVTF
jgi:TonB-linked SusC/RagA family outer membrane protein